MFTLQRKLKSSLVIFKKWCINFKHENQINWRTINEEISANQVAISSVNDVDAEVIRRKTMAETKVKQDFWKQRARTKWDNLVDMNTSFFYKCAATRKARNEIKGLKDMERNWTADDNTIYSLFTNNFYEDLFSASIAHEWNNIIWDDWKHSLPSLSENHIAFLAKPFIRAEIRHTVFSMEGNKSPGPNGVPPSFFHHNWNLIGDDVFKSCLAFFREGFLLKEMNETYITLIHKVNNPGSVANYRPISLYNTFYKIISKCIVRRLRGIIGDLISDNQNAFVPGRSISDSCLLGHEMLQKIKRKAKSRKFESIFKVDLNKAYDSLL